MGHVIFFLDLVRGLRGGVPFLFGKNKNAIYTSVDAAMKFIEIICELAISFALGSCGVGKFEQPYGYAPG